MLQFFWWPTLLFLGDLQKNKLFQSCFIINALSHSIKIYCIKQFLDYLHFSTNTSLDDSQMTAHSSHVLSTKEVIQVTIFPKMNTQIPSRGSEKQKRPWHCTSTAQQQAKHWWWNTILVTALTEGRTWAILRRYILKKLFDSI